MVLVTTTVDNFDSYDTVFIGYPIWWREAAWVVNRFVKDKFHSVLHLLRDRGVSNQHGGGGLLAEDEAVMGWLFGAH